MGRTRRDTRRNETKAPGNDEAAALGGQAAAASFGILELLTAVRKAALGEPFVDSELAAELRRHETPAGDPLRTLSRREIEVLRLLGDGKGLTDIADTLGIAYKTVANTCTRVMEKLGLERIGDLIRFAVENRHNKLSAMGLGTEE